MVNPEKLDVYQRVLVGCEAIFADVPRQWQEWSSLDLMDRQEYMLSQIDNAARNIAEIEMDPEFADLSADVLEQLAAAKRQWAQVEPILAQMEQTFPKDAARGEAA